MKGWSRWAFFFVVIGTNAILVYFGQQVVDFDAISRFFLTGVERYVGIFAPLVIPLGALAAKWAGLLSSTGAGSISRSDRRLRPLYFSVEIR